MATVRVSPVDVGLACVQRIAAIPPSSAWATLMQCNEAVALPLAKCTRSDMVDVIAYLAAQVHGLQQNRDARAQLAMTQIATIVREWHQG
jgi:hypothetical protein